MRILLHTCCGPCTIFPLKSLREKGFEVFGFYYNPNIHPYQEWERRLEALRQVANLVDDRGPMPLIVGEEYPLEEFLRNVVFREENRCIYCYTLRLEATARLAKKSRFDAFTTTLLYSKRQKHDLIRGIAENAGRRFSIGFYYEDFRMGWRLGQEEAVKMGIYRQKYCGCIYSEKERFYKDDRLLVPSKGEK
ncbi:MAG: epoxyqueuosine reductase QueH [Syntrophobacterales bacterium]|nr:epoxyqueuosine reductase QueH [Syntrophobacterales bacterium]